MKPIPGRVRSVAAMIGLSTVCLTVMGQGPDGGPKLGAMRVGKILFLGNSITHHAPAPGIGWTGDWGMAASSREKDYAHLLLDKVAKEAGGVPKVMIRNIADLERKQTEYNIAEGLKDELAFEADVVILAIGENAPAVTTDEARQRFAGALRNLLTELGHHGHPKIFVRSEFWPDAGKDRILKKACEDAGGIFVDLGKVAADPANAARSERQIDHAGVAGHPGDRGMAAIAEELWLAMKRESRAKE